MKRNKEFNILKIIIAVFIIGFAGLSFCPYALIEEHYIFSDLSPGEAGGLADSKTYGYFPIVSCICSAVELLLLLFKNRWARSAGLVINLVKIILPLRFYVAAINMFLPFGGLTRYSYSFNNMKYVMITIGCVIAALYIFEFAIQCINHNKSKT